MIDVNPAPSPIAHLEEAPSKHERLHELVQMYSSLSVKNCQEIFNDAIGLKEDLLREFIQGSISLQERAFADRVFWHLMAKIQLISKELKYIPEDLLQLDDYLRDNVFL